MPSVASRDLRNHTAEVLRRVADGSRVTITVNGRPVAELGPPTSVLRDAMPRAELIAVLGRHRADPALRAELEQLSGETTDDLGPPE